MKGIYKTKNQRGKSNQINQRDKKGNIKVENKMWKSNGTINGLNHKRERKK